MHVLLFLMTFLNPMAPMNGIFEIDFGKGKGGTTWRITNDGVMGGLSKGYIEFTENSLLFSGTVSLENNGGFTSFRSPYDNFDLSNYEEVEVRIKGKGQQLALNLYINEVWYQPYFKKELTVEGEEWQVLRIPLADFQAYQVGRPMGTYLGAKYKGKILGMGLITNAKKSGPFSFEVDYIRFQ